jgi:hypothetical protein
MKSLFSGLVDYWPGYEASGSLQSALGRNNLTDVNTVTSAQGRVVAARQYVKANTEKHTLASNSDVQTGDIDFSFVQWLYLDSTTAVASVHKINAAGTEYEYGLIYNPATGRFEWYISNTGTAWNTSVQASSFGAPSTGTWYMLYVDHDSVNNLIGIMVNAGVKNTTAWSSGVRAGTGVFVIGGWDGPDTWDGRICESGMWKRCLTYREIQYLYNNGLGRTYPFDGRYSPVLTQPSKRQLREVGVIR